MQPFCGPTNPLPFISTDAKFLGFSNPPATTLLVSALENSGRAVGWGLPLDPTIRRYRVRHALVGLVRADSLHVFNKRRVPSLSFPSVSFLLCRHQRVPV